MNCLDGLAERIGQYTGNTIYGLSKELYYGKIVSVIDVCKGRENDEIG
jgi:hypothetical protein